MAADQPAFADVLAQAEETRPQLLVFGRDTVLDRGPGRRQPIALVLTVQNAVHGLAAEVTVARACLPGTTLLIAVEPSTDETAALARILAEGTPGVSAWVDAAFSAGDVLRAALATSPEIVIELSPRPRLDPCGLAALAARMETGRWDVVNSADRRPLRARLLRRAQPTSVVHSTVAWRAARLAELLDEGLADQVSRLWAARRRGWRTGAI